jgi:hypothetical protein
MVAAAAPVEWFYREPELSGATRPALLLGAGRETFSRSGRPQGNGGRCALGAIQRGEVTYGRD